MVESATKTEWDHLSKELIMPLLYFEIFSYPLSCEEIIKFSSLANIPKEKVQDKLNTLVENKILFRINNFYLLSNSPEKVSERLQNNERALLFISKAKKIAHLIACFPFVKAVFVSGSLSKNVMTADDDIDFFIITSQDRLWICRTLLILFKKIFLFNSHKYFCLNYFIDESHLLIEEQNRYTATEIVTLYPMIGRSLYTEFIQKNSWATDFYPNFQWPCIDQLGEVKPNLIHSLFRFLFSGKTGTAFNAYLMQLTLAFWKRKFTFFDPPQFEEAFKSTPFVSKHHPTNFQEKVDKTFRKLVRNFEQHHQILLHESIR